MLPGENWNGSKNFVIQSAEIINQKSKPIIIAIDRLVRTEKRASLPLPRGGLGLL
jgi:hypothetical protein